MRLIALFAMLLAAGCASSLKPPADVAPTLQAFQAPHAVRLRGISAVDARTAWASGQQGEVVRTTDAGKTWQRVPVPDAGKLDLRDIHAFDAQTAVALSIGPGEASRVFRTEDGGRQWQEVARNPDPAGFWDCMVFDGRHGLLLGDPVQGHYQTLASDDGGRSWARIQPEPPALKDEAAFAASGTCVARVRGAHVVATGGGAARLHVLRDGTRQWTAVDAGMARGKPAAGVFSAAALGNGVIAVGGDYTAERAPGNAAQLITIGDGAVKVLPAPRGYRSGVACVHGQLPCIAVGPSGVDRWDGQRWTPIADASFDAIAIAGRTAWLSGANGALGRIDL